MHFKSWTSKEKKNLLEFVNSTSTGDGDRRVALRIWAEENGRNFPGVSYAYYNCLKKQKTGKGYPKSINKNKQKKSKMENRGARISKSWTGEEVRDLHQYYSEGKTVKEIADLLHRNENAVTGKMFRESILRNQNHVSTAVSSRKPVEEYMKEKGYVKAETVAKAEKIRVVTKQKPIILAKGTQISFPILSYRIESGNLIIEL